jgi:hypothetical protein
VRDRRDQTEADQVERSKRLRKRIERLKAGRAIQRGDRAKSLREQVEERANRLRRGPEKS